MQLKNFFEHIHGKETVFEKEYAKELIPHEDKKSKDPFTKDADVVIANIINALEKPRPKPRYYNTSATYLLGGLKRILPTSILDKILFKI